jgi:hypothetical protein
MPPLDIKKSIVLLGAGASQPAGIPTAFAMTEQMLKTFGDDALQRHYLRTTRTIIGALQMASGMRSEESTSSTDIEHVLNAVKLLATRFDTDLSPFVGIWHPFLEELERAHTAIPFEDILKVAGANATAEIARRLSQPSDGRLFQILATILTAKLMQLTWLTDCNASAYFQPLLKEAKTTRLIIATLNYDNSVEIAADALSIPCHTLGDWQTTAILPEPTEGIDLLKLHGSTNWKWSDRPLAVAGITPPRTIREISTHDMPQRLRNAKCYGNSDYIGDSLAVIFGSGNKLTAEGPFIDLLHKFKRLLWQKSHLLVLGYSFRDDHINHLIEHWFTTNQTTTLRIVGAPNSDIKKNPFCSAHKNEIDSRISYDDSGVENALHNIFLAS